jgi:hypothetical protein
MRPFVALLACLGSIAAVASCGTTTITFPDGGSAGTGGAHSTSSGQTGGHASASSSSSGHGGAGGIPNGVGGSGTANGGGGPGGSAPDGGPCTTFMSCAQQGIHCGLAGDGCGDTLDCGTCPAGQSCGAVTAGQCGACSPLSCVQQNIHCGAANDGCGDTLDCGTCPVGQSCGTLQPGQCDTMCSPETCAQLGFVCGTPTDGCGGTLDCGTCAVGQTCGAVTAGQCGTVCSPLSCAQQGFDCGPATNGCGVAINCGTCPAGQTCGLTIPDVCGASTTCPGGGTTSLSGTVYAPNGTDPLYGATVYVPGAAVQPFTPGVSCASCSAGLSGSPLVSTTTLFNGTFTLSGVPAGVNIPLVIQKGRWRRQVVVPTVTACTTTAVSATLTHLPTSKAQGDIPLMAFVTGSVDALECMLRKIGIADSEFTDPSGAGRVQFYLGSGSAGAMIDANTPSETTLWGSQGAIDQYDMVYFACQGSEFDKTTAAQQIVINYTNAGGRVFATHYSYVWLFNDAPFSSTASWAVDPNDDNVFAADPQIAYINQGFTRGMALAQWLQLTGASTTLGQVEIGTLRHDFTGVVAPSLLWLNVTDATLGNVPMHYTFDTPVGTAAASQCGRVLYNDFHAEDADNNPTNGMVFPAECNTTAMTPQERLLEYSIFDLGSCLGP